MHAIPIEMFKKKTVNMNEHLEEFLKTHWKVKNDNSVLNIFLQ